MRRRIFQWTTITCLVLCAGWFLHLYEIHEQKAQAQRLEVLRREHEPTQSLLRQLVTMRQQLVDLQHQESVARELERQRSALVVLGLVSQTAQKTDGRLRVTKLDLSNFQDGGRSGESGTTTRGALTVSGVSLDNSAVAEMLEGMQDSELFTHVELRTLKEREADGVSLRDYQLNCEL